MRSFFRNSKPSTKCGAKKKFLGVFYVARVFVSEFLTTADDRSVTLGKTMGIKPW